MPEHTVEIPVRDYSHELRLITEILQYLVDNKRNIPEYIIKNKLAELQDRLPRF